MARIFKENSFEAGTAGSSGTVNYSTGFGTPAGGNTVQSPDKFGARDLNKAPAHGENQDTGSMLAQLPTRRDRKSSSGAPIKQGVMSDKVGFEDSAPKGSDDKPNTLAQNGSQPLKAEPNQDYYPNGEPPPSDSSNDNQSDIPGKNDDTKKGGFYQNSPPDKAVLQPDDAFNGEVDQLFQKKITPTPDEIMSALQYELNQMVKKDKHIAKATVLKNLKEDPKYYTRLNMLNIDDDKMKVDESVASNARFVVVAHNGEVLFSPASSMEEAFGWLEETFEEWAEAEGDVDFLSNEITHKSSDLIIIHNTPNQSDYYIIDLQSNNPQIQQLKRRFNMIHEHKNEKIKVDENSTFSKTKKLLDQMVSDRSNNRPVQNSKEITNIFKDLWNRRHNERDRK